MIWLLLACILVLLVAGSLTFFIAWTFWTLAFWTFVLALVFVTVHRLVTGILRRSKIP